VFPDFFIYFYLLSIQAQQLESQDTSAFIMGVMLESNLVEGRQDVPSSGPAGLKYGQSVTDACLSWDMTVPALERLREGVRARRELVSRKYKGLEILANGVKELKLNDAGGIDVVNGHWCGVRCVLVLLFITACYELFIFNHIDIKMYTIWF